MEISVNISFEVSDF